MPYDVKTELTQVAIVGRAPGILLVSNNFPANNVKEFVAMAKSLLAHSTLVQVVQEALSTLLQKCLKQQLAST